MAKRLATLEDDCKILLGLPPHDEGSNICKGDNYFGKSLEVKYGKKAVEDMCRDLRKASDSVRSASMQAMKEKLDQIRSGKSGVVKIVPTAVPGETSSPSLEVKKPAKTVAIRKDIQATVDEHINMYIEYKNLEKKLKSSRDSIEPYMKDKSLVEIKGTGGGAIQLVEQNRAPMTTNFTKYEASAIIPLLNANAKKKCVVQLINGEILEAMATLGEVSKELLSFKVTKQSHNFTVQVPK